MFSPLPCCYLFRLNLALCYTCEWMKPCCSLLWNNIKCHVSLNLQTWNTSFQLYEQFLHVILNALCRSRVPIAVQSIVQWPSSVPCILDVRRKPYEFLSCEIARNLEMFLRTKHTWWPWLLICSTSKYFCFPMWLFFYYHYPPLIKKYQANNSFDSYSFDFSSHGFFFNYFLCNCRGIQEIITWHWICHNMQLRPFQILTAFLKVPRNLPVVEQNNSEFYNFVFG